MTSPNGPTASARSPLAQVQQAARQWLEIRRSVTGFLIKDTQPAGGETFMTRFLTSLALACVAFVAAAPAASAMKIEKIVTPAGITAWLVREHTVPMVSLNYAFRGGSSQDEADKSGTANLAADTARRGRRQARQLAISRPARAPRHRSRLQRRARLFPRHAAYPQRAPGRGLRPAASRAHRAALRCRRGPARARPGHGRPAARGHQSQRRRQPALVADRVPRPPVWPAERRLAGRRCRTSPPTTCATTCIACSRATSSPSPSSATSTPRPRPR